MIADSAFTPLSECVDLNKSFMKENKICLSSGLKGINAPVFPPYTLSWRTPSLLLSASWCRLRCSDQRTWPQHLWCNVCIWPRKTRAPGSAGGRGGRHHATGDGLVWSHVMDVELEQPRVRRDRVIKGDDRQFKGLRLRCSTSLVRVLRSGSAQLPRFQRRQSEIWDQISSFRETDQVFWSGIVCGGLSEYLIDVGSALDCRRGWI